MRAGYKKATARSHAWKWMRKPEFKAAIGKAMAERAERTQITADRVLTEIAAIAFTELRQVADWGPEGITAKPSGDLPSNAARAVLEVAESGSGTARRVRVKLHDKKGALDLLAKHLGLYLDKGEVAQGPAPAGLPPLKVILHGTAPPPEAE